MFHIFTTIAQHPKGVNLHLNNIKWAFDTPKQIHILTFDWHQHDMPKNTHLITSNKFTLPQHKYYDFYNDLPLHINKLDDNDIVMFTQQDICFTKKADHLLEGANEAVLLHHNLNNLDYFGILNELKHIIYPRLWEGASLFPARFLKSGINSGVSFGNSLRKFAKNGELYTKYYDLLKSFFISIPFCNNGELQRITDHIKHNVCHQKSEKMFELTLFFFTQGLPFKILEHSPLIHLQGPEKTHRRNPDVYQDLDLMIRDPLMHTPHMNNCAFMYFISEAIEPSRKLIKYLNWHEGISQLKEHTLQLSQYAEEWMSNEQFNRFNWVKKHLFPFRLW